jgi:hypothetical protein
MRSTLVGHGPRRGVSVVELALDRPVATRRGHVLGQGEAKLRLLMDHAMSTRLLVVCRVPDATLTLERRRALRCVCHQPSPYVMDGGS